MVWAVAAVGFALMLQGPPGVEVIEHSTMTFPMLRTSPKIVLLPDGLAETSTSLVDAK